MTATRKVIGHRINYFAARFSGKCASCQVAFEPNDLIGYDEDDNIVGLECCGGIPSDEVNTLTVEPESDGSGFDSFHPGRSPDIRVMPTGKTAKDKCPRCWMIHAVGQGDDCG